MQTNLKWIFPDPQAHMQHIRECEYTIWACVPTDVDNIRDATINFAFQHHIAFKLAIY